MNDNTAASSGARLRLSSVAEYSNGQQASPTTTSAKFDVIAWKPAYESCQRFFLDHAQYDPTARTVAAFLNIEMPHQWSINPVYAYIGNEPPAANSSYMRNTFGRPTITPTPRLGQGQAPNHVSLFPYIRRLVVTGFGKDEFLASFFGIDWQVGVAKLRDTELRNYMFAAKSGGWGSTKAQYDISPQQTVPFLMPLRNVREEDILTAEREWSAQLAQEDWMLGPRAPAHLEDYERPETR